MLKMDVDLHKEQNDDALKNTELENGENEKLNHSCAQVFVRSLSSKSTDSEEKQAIDLVVPDVVGNGLVQDRKERVDQELITGKHVSQQTDTNNYASCLETASNDNCSLVDNASLLRNTTRFASTSVQTPERNTSKFYCMASEHTSIDPCQEARQQYHPEPGEHYILMEGIERVGKLFTYRKEGIGNKTYSSDESSDEVRERQSSVTTAHRSDVSQNENFSILTCLKAENSSQLTYNLNNYVSRNQRQKIIGQIMLKLFIDIYINCMLEALRSYDLIPENEYGCYKDLNLNGLIIDFRPWLEFGDVSKLRTDILSKIPVCIKKGIIVFPEWLSLISIGPIRFQTTKVLGNGGIGSVYSGQLTNGIVSFKMARKVIPRLKWRNEEAEALQLLQGLSLSPDLYGVIVKGGNVSLLMEIVHGVTLSAWFGGDVLDVIELFRELLQNVSILHKTGIFHQDLKVSNIMLRDPNDPKSVVIIDFGSVVMFDSSLNPFRPITHALAPPERHMTNKSLHRSLDERVKRLLIAWDSWSLGIIMFNLLTKKTFSLTWDVKQSNINETRAKLMNFIEKQMSSVTLGHGDVPDYIIGVIKGLLEPDHRRRMTPETALEMIDSRILGIQYSR